MGNVTAKTSGEIATFMTPAKTNIKSLKVHFSPKQLGTGDPSPENVREIVGWDGVEVTKTSLNLLNQSYITEASGWTLSSDNNNMVFCGVPVYKGTVVKFYQKFGSGYSIAETSFKENVQYNVSAWLKTVNGNSFQGLKFGFKYTDGTSSLGNIFVVNDTWKRQTVTSEANKTVSKIYCSYNSSGEIYLCGLAVCEKKFDDINIVHSSTINNISYQWKKLPDEYQEVEYIESDGGQCIDLPFGFDDTDEIHAKVSVSTQASQSDKYIVSPRQWNTNKNRFGIGVYNVYTFAFGGVTTSNTRLTPNVNNDGQLHEWIYKDRIAKLVDLNLIRDLSSIKFGETTESLKLFYGYNSNTLGKIAYYKHKKANGDEYEFIPCYRKSDGEIGMYDTVSQTFYTNQGTGTFLKGNDVDKTFYGGYVDLISGELVQDMAYGQVTSEWLSSRESGYIGYTSSITALGGASGVWVRNAFTSTARERKSGGIKANCNAFKVLMNSTGVSSSQNRTAFAVDSESITSVADFISAVETLEQNGNGLYLAYELAEPITHQLTPTQLQSFVGQNNFWSNADYVEVEYDLIETIDIQKAKQKIILNQPHVESQIGSESSTQVTHFNTNMKAPLKECKVYFNPVQEGSGEPSLTNVRPITGWTGVTLNHTGVNMLECDSPDYFINNAGTNDGIASTLARNTDGIIESITFNGTSTSTNIFRNLNYTPATPSEVTMPSGQIALTSYSSQIYLTPMGNSDIPRTINGKAWHQSYVDTLNNWAIWNVGSSNGYNGLWIRAQMFPQQSGLNIDTTIYPMMCLMEDQGCEFEVYKGNKYNIDWTNDAGTLYGGYIDLVKGELVAEWVKFVFNRNSRVNNSGTSAADETVTWMTLRITHYAPPFQTTPNNGDDYGVFSLGNWRYSAQTGKNRAYVNSAYIYAVLLSDTEDLTTAEGRTAFFDRLEENNIPIECIYKLAEPIHYSLIPQQLLSFKGINNIWANTNGQTEVKYWTYKSIPQEEINYLNYAVWSEAGYISSSGKETIQATSASHFFKTPILLKAGTYNLNGFSNYVGSDNTNYRIHEYNQNGTWVKQITFQQIGNLSPVDISFTLDEDTYVKLSIAMAFEGTLTKVS